MSEGQKIVRKVLRELRRKLPTTYPLKVVWDERMKSYGDCDLKNWRQRKTTSPFFLVRLSSFLHEEPLAAWDVMVHEYAHALTWTRSHSPGRSQMLTDHGPLWGVAYAACYTVAEKFL